jgi:hypothetical protein
MLLSIEKWPEMLQLNSNSLFLSRRVLLQYICDLKKIFCLCFIWVLPSFRHCFKTTSSAKFLSRCFPCYLSGSVPVTKWTYFWSISTHMRFEMLLAVQDWNNYRTSTASLLSRTKTYLCSTDEVTFSTLIPIQIVLMKAPTMGWSFTQFLYDRLIVF